MTLREPILFVYRQLLRLYPQAFRERFAEEMMQVAEAADVSEWPLIMADTSVAVVRSWWQQPHAPILRLSGTEQGAYLSLGESPVRPGKMLQGLVVATLVVLLACYISTRTVWNLPTDGSDTACGKVSSKMVPQVTGPTDHYPAR